jgi:two-component system, cell cycle response regulator CpdR
MGVAGWRFANMKRTLAEGRCWRTGRVAVHLPGGGRYRLADHDRDHVLQGLAEVGDHRDSDSPARPQSEPFRRTAIVVEDDAIQRNMVALLLEERNFTVILCDDAETAFLALYSRHPSVLITDINLIGKMNGLELARLARMNDPMLRVVVISGQHPAAALPDGVTFLSKPVCPAALIREATR